MDNEFCSDALRIHRMPEIMNSQDAITCDEAQEVTMRLTNRADTGACSSMDMADNVQEGYFL